MHSAPYNSSSLAKALALALPLLLTMSCSSSKGHKSDRSATAETAANGGDSTATAGGNGGAADANGNPAEPTVVTPATVGGNAVNALVTHIGVRNFQALNWTMSSLTGVPTTNAAVVQAFADQSSALPTETDVKSFVGSSQVAVFKLAVEYCNAMMTDTAKATAFFAPTVVNDVPSKVFTADGSKAVSEALITKFWGKDLSTLPPLEQSSATLSALITDLLKGKAMTNKAVTTGVLTAACTTVLASAPVTLY